MSRHFCCCIPVRAGVFLFSLLSFLLTGLLAAVTWFIVHQIDIKAANYTNYTKENKIIIIVLAVIFTIMALASFFGFIGSITANRRFVKAYSTMSWILFLLSLASAGLFLYQIYTQKNITEDCIDKDGNGNITVDKCTTHVSTGVKIAATIIVIAEVFTHLYIVTVISRYVEQLDDQGAWQGQYKLTTTDVNQGLLNTTAPYPYSEQQHSYGNA
ncbi:hypothetical protein WOLCODRAFT_141041 [Wolfiporia cocos MD-104 SS10]|uniref:Tetraspannin-domain-containing protein n=1 Tax=Wolfiporia cocos (strain MD-104) TaxID=742152 RepID=A0A2H3J9S6_WOLCO|nr:hypothetical protein WOLCODRAFT_141041 [Wolfiporia cocos MD-104 SS10]